MPKNPILQPGRVIRTSVGIPVRVKEFIAAGGQGAVYRVDFNGEEKALKWYKQGVFSDPAAFYANLVKNTRKGAPSDVFLWP